MRSLKLAPRAVPTKPVVLAVHSSAGSGGQWAALRNAIGDAFDLLTPDLLGQGHATAIVARMPVVLSHFVSLTDDKTSRAAFAKLQMPVLYHTGRTTRASTRRIAEIVTPSMPHVESVHMEAMGHLGPITHAAVVAERLACFLREQVAAPFEQRKAA